MRKRTKIWLIAAASLVTVGGILFASVMTMYHWDFFRLNTVQFETNTYPISEEFDAIKINTETADILFAVSGDDSCSVVCYEDKNVKHSVCVQDGTLTINAVDQREWYAYIGLNFNSPKITVYLPKTEYASLLIEDSTGSLTLPKDFTFGSMDLCLDTGHVDCLASSLGVLKIQSNTGSIHLQDLSAEEVNLNTSTGHVDVQSLSCTGKVSIFVTTGEARVADVSCGSIYSTGDTGSITLKNVLTKNMLSIERSTGNVRLDGCDGGELEIHTDTGSVTGSLLSSKVFITHSDTGSINVPETISGGKCKITTDTGNIRIAIKK